MSSIFSEYVADPARFQRMCEFFLHARFRAVHPSIGKENIFFTVEGELVDVRNPKRRFATFTDWFNAVNGTCHDLEHTGIFDAIHATRRITLGQILANVAPKERAEFQDIKYLSSLAYGYIHRRMRARFIDFKWDKKQSWLVEWKGIRYTVSHTNTTSEGSVLRFLHAMWREETAIQGLYCVMADGSLVLLSEEAAVPEVPEVPEVAVAVAVAPEVTRKEFDDLKTHLGLLHTDLRIMVPLQQADRDTFTREIAELRGLLKADREEIVGLRAENQALAMQCKNLTGLVGLLIQPVGCAGTLGHAY